MYEREYAYAYKLGNVVHFTLHQFAHRRKKRYFIQLYKRCLDLVSSFSLEHVPGWRQFENAFSNKIAHVKQHFWLHHAPMLVDICLLNVGGPSRHRKLGRSRYLQAY